MAGLLLLNMCMRTVCNTVCCAGLADGYVLASFEGSIGSIGLNLTHSSRTAAAHTPILSSAVNGISVAANYRPTRNGLDVKTSIAEYVLHAQ